MSKNIIWVLVLLAIGGVVYFTAMPKKEMVKDTMEGDKMMNKDHMMDDGSMMKDDAMMKKDEAMAKDQAMMQDKEAMMKKEAMMVKGSYEVYSPEKVMKAENGNVVLFFKANWCPSCISVDKDIKANVANIPSNLTILDVNYDNSKDLKNKYGVTYQHTFVQVDKDGNMIKKWSGSATLSSIVSQIK